jgi:SNF2 family DNA or RNA helicase
LSRVVILSFDGLLQTVKGAAESHHEANGMDINPEATPIDGEQPTLITGGAMRPYQIAGVNWLKALYENGECRSQLDLLLERAISGCHAGLVIYQPMSFFPVDSKLLSILDRTDGCCIGLNGILADEMGLGKTLQVGTRLCSSSSILMTRVLDHRLLCSPLRAQGKSVAGTLAAVRM